ncbi:MAG: prepilin-type N-terminal cleavage/methylation domain-containing protein [Rhodocyclaceae bacterium]|nr:prepilin-type N-terminal cleavage/methylation domain-containing protein [Rhodocyclaceae bacterium]
MQVETVKTRTSATGIELLEFRQHPPFGLPWRTAGFTLLEMIVALAIAGLLLGVVPISAHRLYESVQYRATVRDVLTDLRQSRARAASEGRSIRFVVDLQKRIFGVAGMTMREVPADYQLAASLARTEQGPDGVGAIRFFPDGSSSGGSISIVRPTGQGVRLRVDWLLGRITQEKLDGSPT